MSALSSILVIKSWPIAILHPSIAQTRQSLLDEADVSLLETIKLKPKNELTSPFAKLFTVLKSLDVTSVVPNKSVICFGDTAMYLGILGSTEEASKISFADLSFAIVKPSVPPSVIFWLEGRTVDILPVSPVKAVPDNAAMISSSCALPNA